MHDRAPQSVIVGEVHAVDEQPVIGAQPSEPLDGACVVGAFGNVDVHADTVAPCEFGRRHKGVVAAGERCVHPHHAAPTRGQEPLVLGESSTRPVGAMAIGDPIRGNDAHAHLGARIGDDRERSVDRVRRLVMVDDRGTARFECFERAEFRRPFEHLEIERRCRDRHQICSSTPRNVVGVCGGAGIPRANAEYRW